MISRHAVTDSFLDAGLGRREYFHHSVVELGKRYPDALLVMERRGYGPDELSGAAFAQVNVYATDIEDCPDELFFDTNINWHHQQFGRRGLVAAAGLCMPEPGCAFVTLMQSDLLQQIHRADTLRKYKSRLENRFGAWPRILLNAVMDFAVRHEAKDVFIPTAGTIVSLLRRSVDPALFRKIYDKPSLAVGAAECTVKGHEYWHITPGEGGAVRIGHYRSVRAPTNEGKQVCLLHDIEENVDSDESISACRRNLDCMLMIERSRGVLGTYNVLGLVFPRSRERIAADGHEIGFHSYDHDLSNLRQLPRVREVDLQVKGYRPPKSRLTPELTPYALSYWNFEWLASSRRSLGAQDPFVDGNVAHIPIDTDDYPLHTGRVSFEQWRSHILDGVRSRDFYAFSVHDCYAREWLSGYASLLDEISQMAEFRTCDEIAGRLFLADPQSS